jgi:UDP-N-acetylglucosamine 4-epimerase
VTGSAGFIGSHLVHALLQLDQTVVGLDNFSTGHRRNLDEIRNAVSAERWGRHRFVEADIRDPTPVGLPVAAPTSCCIRLRWDRSLARSPTRSRPMPPTSTVFSTCSWPRAMRAWADSSTRHRAPLTAITRHCPKVENAIGRPLSPYAVTKLVNELYADVFARCYGLPSIGLRYFNIFGARQDPDGAYAAVIPRWIRAMLVGEKVVINGDGETSRDFCYVDNAVQANLLAALTDDPDAINQVYNVAVDERTSLNRLFQLLRDAVAAELPEMAGVAPVHGDFRPGDVRHSQADIGKARRLLGYAPTHRLGDGIRAAIPWYLAHQGASPRPEGRFCGCDMRGSRLSQIRVDGGDSASSVVLWGGFGMQPARAGIEADRAIRVAVLVADARAREHGEGVPRDIREPPSCTVKPRISETPRRQFSLGWMYANGRGIRRDNRMASLFFAMAAEQGHEYAKKMLAFVGPAAADLPDCMRDPPPPMVAEAESNAELEDDFVASTPGPGEGGRARAQARARIPDKPRAGARHHSRRVELRSECALAEERDRDSCSSSRRPSARFNVKKAVSTRRRTSVAARLSALAARVLPGQRDAGCRRLQLRRRHRRALSGRSAVCGDADLRGSASSATSGGTSIPSTRRSRIPRPHCRTYAS